MRDDDLVLCYESNTLKITGTKLTVPVVLFFVVLISFTSYAYGTTEVIPVGVLPFEVSINPTTNKAYVAHGDGTVHVIDVNPISATFNQDVKTILVSAGKSLTGITVNTATNKVYVANNGDNNVAVIDGNSDTLQTTIPLVSPLDGVTPVGVFPVDVEVNTNLSTLYVSNVLSLTVVVIDTTTNNIIDVISGFDSPSRFTFVPNTNLMYMTNFFTNEVSVLDGGQNSLLGGTPLIATISVGNGPDGIEFNPTNLMIYTANSADNTVSVIDANPVSANFNMIIDTISVGINPVGVGVNAPNNSIYVIVSGGIYYHNCQRKNVTDIKRT